MNKQNIIIKNIYKLALCKKVLGRGRQCGFVGILESNEEMIDTLLIFLATHIICQEKKI